MSKYFCRVYLIKKKLTNGLLYYPRILTKLNVAQKEKIFLKSVVSSMCEFISQKNHIHSSFKLQ